MNRMHEIMQFCRAVVASPPRRSAGQEKGGAAADRKTRKEFVLAFEKDTAWTSALRLRLATPQSPCPRAQHRLTENEPLHLHIASSASFQATDEF